MDTRRPLLGALALLACGLIPGRLAGTLRDDSPNVADYDRMERGYYERLIDTGRRPEGPPREPQAPFDAGELAQVVDDVREYVLKPNLVASHRGASWSTNGLGMRDREYGASKPRGTFRVALVGDSIAAGWGVDDGLGFEPRLERIWDGRVREGRPSGEGAPPPYLPPQGGRLSEGAPPQSSPSPLAGEGRVGGSGADDPSRVEILNFAVPGHAPGQRWEHFARVGWPTTPALVLFEGTLADLGWDERRLRSLIPRGLGLDASAYRDALSEIGGIAPNLPPDDLKARLRPYREAILLGVYRRVVADCRERGVPVIWVLLPRVGKPVDRKDRGRITRLAKAAGFDETVDLSDAFADRPASSLAIARDDFHPNAEGHATLARRLDAALAEFLSPSARPGRSLR